MNQRIYASIIILILNLILPYEGWTQTSKELPESKSIEKWGLRECIDYAIENNIEIREQALTVKEAETKLSTTRNSRLPDLNAEVNQNFNFGRSQSISTGLFEANQVAGTGFSLSSQTPVFTGFRIKHQTRADKLNHKAETECFHRAGENLELHVTALYLDVLFRRELQYVYLEQKEHAAHMLERTEALVDAGVLSYSQMLEMKAEVAKKHLHYTESVNSYQLALLNLAHSLNIPDTECFDIIIPTAGASNGPVQNPKEVYLIAVNERPVIKEAEYRLESSRAEIRAARSGFWPAMHLNLGYITGYDHIFNEDVPNSAFGKQISANQREVIGLSMSIPVFNRKTRMNNVRNARYQAERRKLELDNARLELYKEIHLAYQSAISAKAKYTASKAANEAASEASGYVRERYMAGLSSVYEYSEIETKLLNATSELLQAEYELLFRNKILDFYQGIPISF